MQIRYHLDESVRNAVAISLRQHGVDVTICRDVDLVGATDSDQMTFTLAEQRVIVTHDDDFLRLDRAGDKHAGIAYCHQSSRTIGEIVRRLVLLWRKQTAEEMQGVVEFL